MATSGDLAKADAVFEATIVSIEDSVGVVGTAGAASATFINGGGSRIVKLKDVRSWRGEAPAVLFTGQGGGDCGYDFLAGELKEAPAQTRVIGTVARITGWDGFENASTPVKGAQVTL